MSATKAASEFCASLVNNRVRYQVDMIRDDTIMVSVAVPGQLWEVEFFDDGSIEVEKFQTLGVESCTDPLTLVLEHYN